MKSPVDARARAQALNPEISVAVSAPAGSGKTGLLTQRVLTLLSCCDFPEEIVSITFTKKAAGEMRQRITQALHQAATTPRPLESGHSQTTWDLAHRALQRDAQQGWHLMQNSSRLRIQTIDGYCRSLTQMNPISSGFGGSSTILDNPQRVYEEAAEDTLNELEGDSLIREDLSNLLNHLDNDRQRCLQLLTDLLSRREQWLEPMLYSSQSGMRQTLERYLDDLIGEELEAAAQLLQDQASDLCILADFAGSQLASENSPSPISSLKGLTALPQCDPSGLPQWKALVTMLLTDKLEWRKSLNKRCGFPAADKKHPEYAIRKQQINALIQALAANPEVLPSLATICHLPYGSYPQEQWTLLNSLTRIMPKAALNLKWVFRKHNAVDFSEITQGALAALGNAEQVSDLTLQLDYQIRHILIDEFQDTSSIQWRMLEQLTAGWEPGDGRTLFIVGDGMQSCYGFRNANVGLFLDARDNGINGLPLVPLDLNVNFRSTASIVSWVNQAFARAFPAHSDISRGAVSYLASSAFDESELNSEAVQTHLFSGESDADAAEAELVAELTREALLRSPHKTVGILVRDRGRLKAIMPTLKRHRIDAVASDIDALSARMAIQDLLSLTLAITDQSDHNAWLAVLRAPWCGLDNNDLLALMEYRAQQSPPSAPAPTLSALLRHHADIANLSEEGKVILSRCVPMLLMALEHRRRKPLRVVVEGIWASLGGPAALLEPADLENCAAYFQLLDEHQHAGQLENWEDFRYAVQRLFARTQPPPGTRVEVMTIHKSKGLEFDTVIIPGLHKSAKAPDSPLFMWQERINRHHEKTLLVSPLAAVGDDQDALYQYLKHEESARQKLEATRLFYVGCTRARSRLHLLGTVKRTEDGNIKPPADGSMLGMVWESVKDSARITDLEPQKEEDFDTRTVRFSSCIRRLSPEWRAPQLSPGQILARFRGHEFDDDENLVDTAAWEQRVERHTGTVIHRAMAQLAREPLTDWTSDRVQQQMPFWKAQLQYEGVSGEQLESSLSLVRAAVERTLKSPDGQWVVNHSHDESGVEIGYFEQQSGEESILDRTFCHQGQRWIVDYKSSIPAQEQSLAGFFEEESSRYLDQLQRYAALFPEARVRTALYFPLLGKMHEVHRGDNSP